MDFKDIFQFLCLDSRSSLDKLAEALLARQKSLLAKLDSSNPEEKQIAVKDWNFVQEAWKILKAADPRFISKDQKSASVEQAITDNKGRRIFLDSHNRIIQIIHPDHRTITYSYDSAGNPAKVTDTLLGTYAYHYDQLDRLKQTVLPLGKIISYNYDSVDNRTAIIYPGGRQIFYKYYPNNWLEEISLADKSIKYFFDKSGNILQKKFPNGVILKYSYNEKGSLEKMLALNHNGSLLLQLTYEFDAVGNCLKIEKKIGKIPSHVKFSYDDKYRLLKSNSHNCGIVKYKYDPPGNRLSVNSTKLGKSNLFSRLMLSSSMGLLNFKRKIHKYTYSNDCLTQVGNFEFQYDDHGNLISKKQGKDITTYHYDNNDNLLKINFPHSAPAEYRYDYLGRRIEKIAPDGTVKRYIYDGHNVLQELDNKGKIIAEYVYELNIDRLLCMIKDDKMYYYICDHLGSVIALTDESGSIISSYDYDPWGNIITENDKISSLFTFTGREYDRESGLYYCRARYYDPIVGRFISPDPLPSPDWLNKFQNRYSYVNNNPLSYSDPFGLMPYYWWEFWAGPLQGALNNMFKGGMFTQNPILPAGSSQYLFNFPGFQAAANWGMQLSGIAGFVKLGTTSIAHFQNPDGIAGTIGMFDLGTKTIFSMFGAQQGVIYGAMVGGIPGALIGGIAGSIILGNAAVCGRQFITNTVMTQCQNILQSSASFFRTIVDNIMHTVETFGHITVNSFQALPGGVLFDKAAEVFTDLEDISGAYWDEQLGQLVVVGTKNNQREHRLMPRMDKDHLIVALKSVFSGDNLGVSIDPPPEYLNRQTFPPDGTAMQVRYIGATQNTLFGAIMFEADRLLKSLTVGSDSVSKEPLTTNVPDFYNELELGLKFGCAQKHTWSRKWFVIDDMRLELSVKETSDRSALVFGSAKLKVKTEYLSQDKNPGKDANAERFADHFTLHFDDFASEFPILKRLKELAKITALAKWLLESGKNLDFTNLTDCQIANVPTPQTTPGITASKSQSAGSHTTTMSVHGGVDFDFEYQAEYNDHQAQLLKNTAEKLKPCESALKWDFNSNGNVLMALAMPLQRPPTNAVLRHTDFCQQITPNLDLKIVRRYDSQHILPTTFGHIWTLHSPYEIHILNSHKSHSPIILWDRKTEKAVKYNYVPKDEAYFLIIKEQKTGKNTYSFSYDPLKSITRGDNGSYIFKAEDKLTYIFDSSGRLTSINDLNHQYLHYQYDNNSLKEIIASNGRRIQLHYNSQGVISRITAPGNTIIDYLYNRSDDLIKVIYNQGDRWNYSYRDNHRLSKVNNLTDHKIERVNTDSLGRRIENRQDVVAIDRQKVFCNYDQDHRLSKEQDEAGNQVSYNYDLQNNLISAVLKDSISRSSFLTFDQNERIKQISNPLGHITKFTFDEHDNLTSIIDANGHTESYTYNDNNKLSSHTDALGNKWSMTYDSFLLLKTLIDPSGHIIDFTYNSDNLLEKISLPSGFVHFIYNKKYKMLTIIDANGNNMEIPYLESFCPPSKY